MKRIFAVFLLAFCAIFTMSALPKEVAKKIKKETKLMVKNMKSEGFELLSPGDLEIEVSYYLQSVYFDGHQQVVGTMTNRHFDLARNGANFNALMDYCDFATQMVRGRLIADSVDTATIDKVCSEYFHRLSGNIHLKPSFTVIKQETNGMYTCRSYFTVDGDLAEQAKEKVLTEVLNELK